jgi:hypothetical protein
MWTDVGRIGRIDMGLSRVGDRLRIDVLQQGGRIAHPRPRPRLQIAKRQGLVGFLT